MTRRLDIYATQRHADEVAIKAALWAVRRGVLAWLWARDLRARWPR